MIANIASVVTSVVGAMGSFLTPTAVENTLLTTAAVTSIGVLFAVPIGIKAGKKAFGLIRKI